MFSTYKCGNCGVVTDDKSHICKPEAVENPSAFCGSGPDADQHICESMAQHLSFQCSTCGRPADKPELVCKPVSIR